MLSILTSFVISMAFSSAAPTEQSASTELSHTAILQERDNGDIAGGFAKWNSRVSQSYGYYHWIFGNAEQQYNISMDACLKNSDVIGVWDFEDGTTKNDATLGEIKTDLGFGTPSTKYAHRALQNTQLAVKEAQAFSKSLMCTDPTAVQLENQAQLRHLLAYSKGAVTTAVAAASYGVIVYLFYGVIALVVHNPVAKLILDAVGLFGIVFGGGLIGILATGGDFANIEAAIIGSVFISRIRQMILRATQTGRAAGPCLPAGQVTGAAIQAAAEAGQAAAAANPGQAAAGAGQAAAAADPGQAVAAANPALGVGAAVGTVVGRIGSCPNFNTPPGS